MTSRIRIERIAEKAIRRKMRDVAKALATLPRYYEWDPYAEWYHDESRKLWDEFENLKKRLSYCKGAKVPKTIEFDEW